MISYDLPYTEDLVQKDSHDIRIEAKASIQEVIKNATHQINKYLLKNSGLDIERLSLKLYMAEGERWEGFANIRCRILDDSKSRAIQISYKQLSSEDLAKYKNSYEARVALRAVLDESIKNNPNFKSIETKEVDLPRTVGMIELQAVVREV